MTASLVRSSSEAEPLPRPMDQSERTEPSQIPKTAPSGSTASAARPVWKASGPTPTVPPRSWIRAAASSTSVTLKYGVQETATWSEEASAPIPATGRPSVSATEKSSPSPARR